MNLQTESSQRAHYADVKRRLWGNPKNVKETPVACLPEPKKALQIPEWEQRNVNFDQHVIMFRHIQAILSFSTAGRIKLKENDWEVKTRRTMREICEEVLQGFPGITLEQVRGVSRNAKIVAARHECIYEVRMQRWDLSYPYIGRWFGGRDHGSIIVAYNKIAARKGDPEAMIKHQRKVDRTNSYKLKALPSKAEMLE